MKRTLLEEIKHFGARLAFGIANIVMRIMYPPDIEWEDKKAAKEAMKSPCVLFSNHVSHVDGLYLTRMLARYHVHTFVGRDYYDKKKINWLFRNLPYIPIDRQEMDTSWLSLGEEKLAEGYPVYMFPEGKTSRTGEMNEFKPGFLMLAKRSLVPVIPIYINGSFKAFHRINIIIGRPMSLDLNEEGRPSVVLKKYAAECREAVGKLKGIHDR